jgi:hypothetical protein
MKKLKYWRSRAQKTGAERLEEEALKIWGLEQLEPRPEMRPGLRNWGPVQKKLFSSGGPKLRGPKLWPEIKDLPNFPAQLVFVGASETASARHRHRCHRPPPPPPSPGTAIARHHHRRIYAMENRKPKRSGVSDAPPLCAIFGPRTTSAPPSRRISGAPLLCHISDVGMSSVPLPHDTSDRLTSAPPPRHISGARTTTAPLPHARPPRPNTHLKTHRRTFVVSASRLGKPPPPPGQDGPSPGGVLPRHCPDDVPPRDPHTSSMIELLSSPRYNNRASPLDHATDWDIRSSASTLPLAYAAAEDDQSPTRMPVFDWTPTPTPLTADNASQVLPIVCAALPCQVLLA